MAKAIGRETDFSGELIRQYELGKNAPGSDACRALAIVFDRPESYIQFGVMPADTATARQPAAAYDISEEALKVARGFDQLTPDCQEHVSRQIELLRGTQADSSGRRNAAQHDVRLKGNALQTPGARKKARKGVR